MSSMPTVLFTLEFYDKSGGGVYEVISQVARRFYQAGYKVKVATTTSNGAHPVGMEIVNGIEVNRFQLSGNLAMGLKGDLEGYKDFLINEEYDVMINYAAQQAMTDVCFLYSSFINRKKILIPCGYSGLYWPHFAEYFRTLPTYLKRYNAQIFHSLNYRDCEFAEKNGIGNLYLVPNGFDRDELEKTPEFSFREKYDIKKDTKMFLNVSNITGAKGHTRAMLTYLLSFIPNSVMVFNGIPMHPKSKHLMKLAKLVNRFSFGWKRILFVEYHHPTTLHMMKEADVFLFFSNIEYSPLVLFEAAAAGLPFLASDCGNSREIAEWTGIGQIVETVKTPNGFSNVSIKDAVKKLRALVAMKQKPTTVPGYVDNYNWDALFKKYEDVVQKVLSQ